MKTLFIHAKSTVDVVLPDSVIKKLPKKVGIVTSIQFLHQIENIAKQIKGSIVGGQVLGCNATMANKIKSKVDAYLFVGSGIFHPIKVALDTGKQVFLFNPITKEFKKIEQKQVDEYKKRKKAAINKFLHADKVGIIVSTKIGQKNLQRALELKKKTDKQYFVFVCDTLNTTALEDFNFIDCWVNTACPRISDEKPNIVNINDLVEAGLIKFLSHKHYEQPIFIGTKGISK